MLFPSLASPDFPLTLYGHWKGPALPHPPHWPNVDMHFKAQLETHLLHKVTLVGHLLFLFTEHPLSPFC